MIDQQEAKGIFTTLVKHFKAKHEPEIHRIQMNAEREIAPFYEEEMSLGRKIEMLEVQKIFISYYVENPTENLLNLNAKYLSAMRILQNQLKDDALSRIKARDDFYDKRFDRVVAFTHAAKSVYIDDEQKCIDDEVEAYDKFMITEGTSEKTLTRVQQEIDKLKTKHADVLNKKAKIEMDRDKGTEEFRENSSTILIIKPIWVKYITAFFTNDSVTVGNHSAHF